jgi:hypothetical protein
MGSGEWFRILSGEHEGRWHLAGWMLSARLGVSSGPRDDGWLGFGTCPRCYAMVLSEAQWAHEDWHAATDYPHPSVLPG